MILQRLSKRLVLLTENKSVPKYIDRQLVDYWRTVQGTNVGFHGKVPGEGIPIAGPPVLTGGSGSGNPLLEPLLKKYKAGTFTGDAIRKKNFPLSLAIFFDNVLGTDKKINADMAKLLKAQEASGKYPSGYLTKRFAGKGAEHSNAYDLINENFGSSGGDFSYVAKHLNTLGVSGSFKGSEPAKNMTTEQLHARLKAKGTSPEALTEVIRDVYLLNQAVLRKKGVSSEPVTRGFGAVIPGLNTEDSLEFVMQAKRNGVAVRLAGHRSCASTASGDSSSFGGFGFQSVDVPIEAALSSWNGTRIQGGKFPNERETMMMGIADLAIDPKHLTNSAGSVGANEVLNKIVAAKVVSDAAKAASGGAASAPFKGTGGPTASSPASTGATESLSKAIFGGKAGPYLAKSLAQSKGKTAIAEEAFAEGQAIGKTMNDIDTDFATAEKADKDYKEARAKLPAVAAIIALGKSNDMDKPLDGLTIGYLATANGIAESELAATSLSQSQIQELLPKVKDYLAEGNFRKKPPASTPLLNRLHALAKQGPTADHDNGALWMSNDERAGLMAAEYFRSFQPLDATQAEKTIERYKDLYDNHPWVKGVKLRLMAFEIDEKNITNINNETAVTSTLSAAMFGIGLLGDVFMGDDQIALALGYAKKFGVDRADAVRQFSSALDIMTSDYGGIEVDVASLAEEEGPVAKAVYDAAVAFFEKNELQGVIKKRAQKRDQIFAKFNPGF
jgi:hypothetical protein